jgi:hypothetical protein
LGSLTRRGIRSWNLGGRYVSHMWGGSIVCPSVEMIRYSGAVAVIAVSSFLMRRALYRRRPGWVWTDLAFIRVKM